MGRLTRTPLLENFILDVNYDEDVDRNVVGRCSRVLDCVLDVGKEAFELVQNVLWEVQTLRKVRDEGIVEIFLFGSEPLFLGIDSGGSDPKTLYVSA